jgi:hypothetical protein
MIKRLVVACVAAALVHIPHAARAQFTDPRNYQNAAVGTNQLELSYAYVHADASIDTSLIITGAHLNVDEATFDYTRYFGVLHRLMWVEAAFPVAGLGGSIDGTNIHGSAVGAGDSSYAVAMLLKGGPALGVEQFQNYKPTTTLGVSLTTTAPTGAYDPEKILNLGADRWSFKPEIALSHPFGPEQKWQVDGYANVYFYTDNTSYHGTELLRQQALSGFEGHLSYAFTDSIWVALDTRNSFRASTFVDGVSQDNPQRNFIAGSEVNVALNSRSSLVFEVAKAFVHVNGPSLFGLSVKYDYTWAKGTPVAAPARQATPIQP